MVRNVSGVLEKRAPAGIICGPGSFAGRDHLRAGIICGPGSFAGRDHLRGFRISSLLLVDGAVGMPRLTRHDGINWKGFLISQAFKFDILYSLPAFDSYGISFYSVLVTLSNSQI